jgi:Fe-S-cluster containining protein
MSGVSLARRAEIFDRTRIQLVASCCQARLRIDALRNVLHYRLQTPIRWRGVSMSRTDRTGDQITGTVELKVAGRPLRVQMQVPVGPTRPGKLLPLFRSVANAVVDVASKAVEAQGATISCTKGCGACCRQLVPISGIEASQLNELVDDMPEHRATEIRARFAAARAQLEKRGILAKLIDPRPMSDEEIQALGLEYFAEGIACPMLEDESCSIHPERPIACREYLVTSPAEHCSTPNAENIHLVPMPAKVSRAVRRMDSSITSTGAPWVPLILALEWAQTHEDRSSPRPGPELAREFFTRFARNEGAHTPSNK